MAFYKVFLEIEKIVECDSPDRAIELARSDISESDLYSGRNWSKYELSESDMQAEHNKQLGVIS